MDPTTRTKIAIPRGVGEADVKNGMKPNNPPEFVGWDDVVDCRDEFDVTMEVVVALLFVMMV